MSLPPDDLIKWVNKQRGDITEDGGLERFELYHTVNGEHSQRILNLKDDEEKDVDDIIGEIWDAAENDASTRMAGIPERYEIHAYKPDEKQSDAQFAFNIAPNFNHSIQKSGSSELPNEKGVTGQMLRHNNALHEMVIRYSEAMGGRMAKELERETALRHKYEDQQLELMRTMQDLLDRKHERDLAALSEARKAETHERLLTMFMSVAPALLSQLPALKGAQMPNSGNPARDIGVGKLLESLDQEEIKGMLATLKPEKQMAFFQLYQSYRQDAENQQKENN